ncbi:hypothetical protein PBY51_011868 [Eleginops maclovinus]|uniref:SH2 domain-containing protein n=2 Tax=Eleginops maclovinus TaxID=56733 RepID=A0AAN8AUA3_ELEMC|nr:hypothetical protein PBY51_011868 [Eleginops maclovinus]
MTPGSHHTLSRKGIEQHCCMLYKQPKARCEKICHFTESRTKDQRHTKSPCFRNCLTFCFKERARMEQREPRLDVEGTEGGLRELASKWFIDTQLPNIVQNGFFPSWFQGFITRKEAEEILREKELGCFLIRLSKKAIGYILSYKGGDRCRHFVISQNESGKFVVFGETKGHDSVYELIDYYQTNAIQPFDEYLASSCFEALDKELYDTIQVSPKERPVGAVKNIQTPQINSAKLPALPRRIQEEVPPLPRRSRNMDIGPPNDPEKALYAQFKKQTPREIPRSQLICQGNFPGDNPVRPGRSTTQDQNSRSSSPSGPESVYSELSLLDTKSRSLPLLHNSCEGEQSYRLSAPPLTPPRLSPKPVRQANTFGPLPEGTDFCSTQDHMSDTAVYHLAGRASSPHNASSGTGSPEQHRDTVYAKVSNKGHFSHTYEQIPGHKDTVTPEPDSNTYEPLKNVRPKNGQHTCGFKNDKWKWLFPEIKKKW